MPSEKVIVAKKWAQSEEAREAIKHAVEIANKAAERMIKAQRPIDLGRYKYYL
jgi:hypothetical protein